MKQPFFVRCTRPKCLKVAYPPKNILGQAQTFRRVKDVFVGIAVVCLFFSFLETEAQSLDKKELKVWKQKKKKMNPLEFKEIFEEYGKLQGLQSKHNRNVKALKKQINQQAKQITDRSARNKSLLEEAKALKEKCEKTPLDVSPFKEDYTKGVVYKVQIGAYEKIDLSEFSAVLGNFGIENEEGINKYTVAYFRKYQQAHIFKKYIRAMGITDAWVVVYQDNLRKNINDFIPAEKSLEE